MKKKILVVASTTEHLMNFHIPYINELKKDYEVLTMAKNNGSGTADFNIEFEKKIITIKHRSCIKQIYNILKENQFDTVILNTSLAAWIVRRAIRKLKNKPNVINIVHGYLFGENSCLCKRLGYIYIEKSLKKVTNSVVVMNDEDFDIAYTHKLAKEHVVKINGMGIDGDRFTQSNEKDYTVKNDPQFSFIGELSARKNQIFLIKFIQTLDKFGFEAKLNLIGWGSKQKKLEKYIVSNNLQNRVKLIGYDVDIEKYLDKSDYYVCASKIEGLPFNILEAMYAGKVIFCSDTKGSVDVIKDFENGILFENGNMKDFVSKFRIVNNDIVMQKKIRKNAIETAEKYLLKNIFEENMTLFKDLIEGSNNSGQIKS